MNIGDIIQNIATGGAVFLGIVYILGGLIVNLNLSRRGIVEYQILKVKYLAVGIIFMFHFLGALMFTIVPVVLFSLLTENPFSIEFLVVPSILAALMLLYVWSRYPPNTKSFMGTWGFWFICSAVAMLYPSYVILRQILLPSHQLEWVYNTLLAILTGSLTIMAQIYHYSSFYYGRPARFGASDPIGIGIPTRVNILCDEKVSTAFQELGLPIKKNIIGDVYLIDETDQHYIVALEQVPGDDANNETYKIDKSLVKVILHRPDHMKRRPSNPMPSQKKAVKDH